MTAPPGCDGVLLLLPDHKPNQASSRQLLSVMIVSTSDDAPLKLFLWCCLHTAADILAMDQPELDIQFDYLHYWANNGEFTHCVIAHMEKTDVSAAAAVWKQGTATQRPTASKRTVSCLYSLMVFCLCSPEAAV